MNPTERRALLLLLCFLLLAITNDLLLTRRPAWFGRLLGRARLRELLAAGRADPAAEPRLQTSSPAGEEKAQPRPRIDRKLPYDDAGRLDLNRADSSDLILLKGVGPVLAGRILEQRRRLGEFGSTGDLLGVRGIGPKTLAKLLPQIVVGVVKDSLDEAGLAR